MSLIAPFYAGLTGDTIEEKTRHILGWTPSAPAMPSSSIAPSQTAGDDSKPTKRKSRGAAGRRKTSKTSARFTTTVTPYPMDGRRLDSGLFHGASRCYQQLTPPASPLIQGGSVPNSRKSSFDSVGMGAFSSGSPNVSLPVSPVSPNTPHPYFMSPVANCAAPQPHHEPHYSSYPSCSSHVSKSSSSPSLTAAGGDPKVFERLRQLVPSLSADKDAAYRLFTNLVSNVIDLEHQLDSLKEQTRGAEVAYTVMQQQQLVNGQLSPTVAMPMVEPTASPSSHSIKLEKPALEQQADSPLDVPADLFDIDVSAFKCLVDAPSSLFCGGVDETTAAPPNGRFLPSSPFYGGADETTAAPPCGRFRQLPSSPFYGPDETTAAPLSGHFRQLPSSPFYGADEATAAPSRERFQQLSSHNEIGLMPSARLTVDTTACC